jgi:hypothetical protein
MPRVSWVGANTGLEQPTEIRSVRCTSNGRCKYPGAYSVHRDVAHLIGAECATPHVTIKTLTSVDELTRQDWPTSLHTTRSMHDGLRLG